MRVAFVAAGVVVFVCAGQIVGIAQGKEILMSSSAQAQSAGLLGTWRLVSYEGRDSSGKVQYPLGEHVTGLLVYDATGNVSAHIMRTDRPLFAEQDSRRGTDSEVRAAFEGHVSYFGTYVIDRQKQTVTHRVIGASFPNWIGSEQLRYYRFEGPRLLLSTPPIIVNGQSLEFVLIWERLQ
jgi:hypothetical protein